MGAELTERRVAIVLMFLTLTGVAYFLARGATRLVAGAVLGGGPASLGASVSPLSGSGAATSRKEASPLFERNIFDSTPPPAAVEATPAAAPAQPLDPNAPPPPCEGAMRLVSAFQFGRTPERSFASITTASGTPKIYTLGTAVEGRELLEVRTTSVILRPTGRAACELAMFRSTNPAMAEIKPVVAAVTPEGPSFGEEPGTGPLSPAEMDRGIQKVSDTSFNVNREFLNRVLANQSSLLTQARVVPHEENGRIVGLKMYGIRRSALLGRLGLQNGDVLRTINGYDMSDPTGALDAYARLREAPHLTVSVIRRGTPTNMDYNVR